MDADDLDYFRTLLDERQIEAEEELEAIGDATDPIAPDKSIGRLSRLDAMQMREMSLEQERRLKKRLRQVREALARIEKGSYGECTNCGRTIEFKRLQARPETEICTSCAGRFE